MALTYANLHRTSIGANFLVVETLTPAASDYTTGGYLLDPTVGGMLPDSIVKAVWQAGTTESAITSAYRLAYNYTTLKLQVFGGAASGVAGAEVANATDLSAVVFVICVIGK